MTEQEAAVIDVACAVVDGIVNGIHPSLQAATRRALCRAVEQMHDAEWLAEIGVDL